MSRHSLPRLSFFTPNYRDISNIQKGFPKRRLADTLALKIGGGGTGNLSEKLLLGVTGFPAADLRLSAMLLANLGALAVRACRKQRPPWRAAVTANPQPKHLASTQRTRVSDLVSFVLPDCESI